MIDLKFFFLYNLKYKNNKINIKNNKLIIFISSFLVLLIVVNNFNFKLEIILKNYLILFIKESVFLLFLFSYKILNNTSLI